MKKMESTKLCCFLIITTSILVAVYSVDEPLSSSLPGCIHKCGDIDVPYPFGIATNSSIPNQEPCFLDPKFKLSCENNGKLYWGDVQVFRIDIPKNQLEVSSFFSEYCIDKEPYNDSSFYLSTSWLNTASLSTFSISGTENKFITVGCSSFGFLESIYYDELNSTSCLTICEEKSSIKNGTCLGLGSGCCQVDIPSSMRNITITAAKFSNSTETLGNCSYSFVVRQGFYDFSLTDLYDFPLKKLPMVLDWSVGERNCALDGSACRSRNSYCEDNKDIDFSYRCRCNSGYEGNPYLSDGCTDIDECKTPNLHKCIDENYCHNNYGSYECVCPKGQSGNGTKEGGGCHQKQDIILKVATGISAGLIILFAGISLLFLMYQKRKLIKLKEKFFQQNGGSLLLQQFSTREDSSRNAQIYTEEQLKKATNNYDESLIIGRGGFGIVFKGFLRHNKIVAIKKSKTIDASQIDQFIKEVYVLSQINHRNVVKLLGCCLETEVPLLVYEFVSNGTLLDFIHSKHKENNFTWKTCLKIATEIAGALSYLHSSASIPIIHRDVKSANILLDDTYTAKVSDFGASRFIPLDQTEIATIVQGTLGYLDPEYMLTQQLTDKSDVYSFGVVLAELLTGEKPISFEREEQKRNLAMYFLSCLKEDRIFEVVKVGILNDDNREEIKEVAILAAKCMRLRGEERPSMKEVAMELEGIRLMDKHISNDPELNLEETQNLLQEVSSSIYETGDSSDPRYTGYDSLRDHALTSLDNGR